MHILTKFAHNINDKGDIMDDKFLCGIVLGMLGGVVLATNSVKARQVVRDGQDQVMQKVSEISEKTKKKSAK